MFRLLTLLQLTRAALAFTAIADAWTIILLHPATSSARPESMSLLIAKMIVMGVVSFGLYGFGMALNDLLDARRDRIFAPRRPIPSGRIQPRSAIIIALVLLMAALLAAAFITPMLIVLMEYAKLRWFNFIPFSFVFAFATAALIVFYDATSKHLGGLGLITLGGVRALHCLIGNPNTPLLFLSMILLTHVTLISMLGYRLENKRPRLKWADVGIVVVGLLLGNGLALLYMDGRNALTAGNLHMLLGPIVAGTIYCLWIISILLRPSLTQKQKGDKIVLLGLFWLFVYDASILVANGQLLASLAITLLLVCAICSFFGIRFFSRLVANTPLHYRAERGLTSNPHLRLSRPTPPHTR